ncbi:hypothetical protein CAPN004_20860 [Capnocytophaga cynodegmi]|uniref:OmpA family protein n=1 Tax=Capnocytophaga cynodegmi TaxID=28189 RepID=UPI001AD5311F|nr:OmpA family protein [Capnocytophaga cynodegmi]GIM53056.1 hypothetical protein CAPN004_20860 [Capnocytophaga cynodegmi]
MKQLFYILGILLTIVFGAYLQYHFCCQAVCYTDNVSEQIVKEEIPEEKQKTLGFSIVTDSLRLEHSDNFKFARNSYEINPINTEINALIDQSKEYFKVNNFKVLEIVGLYSADETNHSVFPTIGLARANAVKMYFEKRGFPSQQIKISDKLEKQTKQNDQEDINIVTIFQVTELTPENQAEKMESFKAFAKDIRENPIRLYFETGESHINLTMEEREKIQKLNDYISQVEGACVQVIGHTDNVGKRPSNLRLGEERAAFVKSYLVKNHFPESLVEVISHGPDKPIASNKTQEGKAKNRRVEITLE